jgi:hypothetical protein
MEEIIMKIRRPYPNEILHSAKRINSAGDIKEEQRKKAARRINSPSDLKEYKSKYTTEHKNYPGYIYDSLGLAPKTYWQIVIGVADGLSSRTQGIKNLESRLGHKASYDEISKFDRDTEIIEGGLYTEARDLLKAGNK